MLGTTLMGGASGMDLKTRLRLPGGLERHQLREDAHSAPARSPRQAGKGGPVFLLNLLGYNHTPDLYETVSESFGADPNKPHLPQNAEDWGRGGRHSTLVRTGDPSPLCFWTQKTPRLTLTDKRPPMM